MRVSLYIPLLLTLLAVRGVPVLGRRLAPAAATRVLTGVAAAAAVGTVWGLGLTAIAGLLHTEEVLGHAHLSARQIQAFDPVPKVIGLLAALLLAAAAANLVRSLARRRRVRHALSEVLLAAPDTELIVFTDPAPRAYAIPGNPARVAVSDSMLALLDGRGRRVLLAHERAHLRHHHHRFLLCADLAAVVNPLLRKLCEHIGFQIERWADEDAATAVGDRAVTARTLAVSALAARGPALAFGDRDVTERVKALIAPPPNTRPGWSVPAAAIIVLGGLALLDSTYALARIAAAMLG